MRNIIIPKSKGEKRPRGIPNISKDRAVKYLIKYAVEPVYESYGSKGS